MKKTGVQLIAEERQRQIEVKGYTHQHDVDSHVNGRLVLMAAVYAIPPSMRAYHYGDKQLPKIWPIGYGSYKPCNDRIRELQKAGALIAAEIDRLQRMEISESHEHKQ